MPKRITGADPAAETIRATSRSLWTAATARARHGGQPAASEGRGGQAEPAEGERRDEDTAEERNRIRPEEDDADRGSRQRRDKHHPDDPQERAAVVGGDAHDLGADDQRERD